MFAITAAVTALGSGQIKPEEMPVNPKTRQDFIRYAPGFASGPPAVHIPQHPYTIDALAKFLGEVDKDGKAHQGFIATFGALELISEGHLTESSFFAQNRPLTR